MKFQNGDILKAGNSIVIVLNIEGEWRTFYGSALDEEGVFGYVSPVDLILKCGYEKIGNLYTKIESENWK